MFLSYYGLERNLFQKEIGVEEGYRSENYKRVMSRLEYIKEVKGIGLFIGATGIGKTYCIRSFKEGLNRDIYKLIYISAKELTLFEFLNEVCKELGLDVGNCYKNEVEHKIQKAVKRLKEEENKETIIVIDNAESLGSRVITELKFIYEFDMDSVDYISIILVGTEILKEELKKAKYEAFQQRIIMQYRMVGLTREEVKEYIKSRLELAGQKKQIFSERAMNALYNVSGGKIRKLNNIIITSMMIGYQNKKTIIDEEIVRMAKEEQEI